MERRYYLNNVRKAVCHGVKEFSADEVREALGGTIQPWCLDRRYRALPRDVWELIIGRNRVDSRQYKAEFFDCDDFAAILYARTRELYEVNGCGLVIDASGRHAYNVLLVVDSAGRLGRAWLEPQSDLIMTVSPRAGVYKLEEGVIIL